MKDAEPGSLWTAEQVAARLSLPVRSIWAMSRRGELPTIRFGRRLRFDPRDVQLFVDRRTSTRPTGTRS
jgi:excisionase family DNA binding protein